MSNKNGILHFWKFNNAIATRFKEENNLQWHCVLLADQKNSGIPTRRWISLILYRRLEFEKNDRDFLFAKDNGRESSIGYYDPMFRNLLERGKKDAPRVFHRRSFHWRLQSKKKPQAWSNHGGREQQCGHYIYRTN